MTSKNRCKCFSGEINTMLVGLRREGPSTERSTLERLVNLLSRAAVKDSRESNPQKVWTKELQPAWWPEVTELRWKNPREHPKDKKDDLRKKVRILYNKLSELGRMTSTLEEEFQLSENSKRADIELKSDFEAIIAKVSGLHCMLDNALKKLKAAKAISEKISTYVRQIGSCFGKCNLCVEEMKSMVDASDKRKDDLWTSMGVSRPNNRKNSSGKKAKYDPFLSGVGMSLFEEEFCPEPDHEILLGLSTDDSSEGDIPMKSKPDSTTKPKAGYADSSKRSHESSDVSSVETMHAARDLVRIQMDEGVSSMEVSGSALVSSRPPQASKTSAKSSGADQFIPLESLAKESSHDAHSKSRKISVQKSESIRKDDKNALNDARLRQRPASTVVSTEVPSPEVVSDESLDSTNRTVTSRTTRDSKFFKASKRSKKTFPAQETARRHVRAKFPLPADETHEIIWVKDSSSLAEVVEIIDETPAPTVDMYVSGMDVDCELGRDTSDQQHIPSCEEILPSVEGIIMDGLAKDAVSTPDVSVSERGDDADKRSVLVGRKRSESADADVVARESRGTAESFARENENAMASEVAPHSRPETQVRPKKRTESLSAAIGAELIL